MCFPFYFPTQKQDDQATTSQSATFEAREKSRILFFSAEHVIEIVVNGQVMVESEPAMTSRTQADIDSYVRWYIRSNYEKLRDMNVDADHEYIKRGGSLDDI